MIHFLSFFLVSFFFTVFFRVAYGMGRRKERKIWQKRFEQFTRASDQALDTVLKNNYHTL